MFEVMFCRFEGDKDIFIVHESDEESANTPHVAVANLNTVTLDDIDKNIDEDSDDGY